MSNTTESTNLLDITNPTDQPLDEKRRKELEAQRAKEQAEKKKKGEAVGLEATDGMDLLFESFDKALGKGTHTALKSNATSQKMANRTYTDGLVPRAPRESARELEHSFSRQASKVATEADEYLDKDGNPKKLSEAGYENFLGLNGIMYQKAIQEDLKPEDKYQKSPFSQGGVKDAFGSLGNTLLEWGNDFIQQDGNETLQTLFKPDQKYSFLYPSVNAEGHPTLKEFVGTKAEFAKTGLKAYQTFGEAADEDGIGTSWFKGLHGGISSGVDAAVGVLKGGKDLIMIGGSKLPFDTLAQRFDKDLKEVDALDRLYDAMQETSENSSLIPSKESEKAGSLDWFASGMGGMMGSQVVFMGAGLGVKAAFTGVNALGAIGSAARNRVLGMAAKGATRKILAEEALRTATTYGASGVVNFGFAYNEAQRAGLSDTEALAFGASVGAINSLIETQLIGGKLGNWLTRGKIWGAGKGNAFDEWLANGGSRNVTADLLRIAKENGGEITEEATEGVVKRTLSKLRDRIAPGQMAEEATEEMLQSMNEQGSKLAFNAIYGDDRLENKGKFDQDKFSFTQAVQEGFFAAISTGATKAMSGRQQQTLYGYVADGQAEDLRVGLDQLLDKGLDLKTRNRMRAEVDMLDGLYKANADTFIKVDGKYGHQMKSALLFLHNNRVEQQQQIDKANADLEKAKAEIMENHPAGQPLTAKEEAKLKPYQERIEKLGKGLDTVNAMIAEYETEEGRSEIEKNFEQRDDTAALKRERNITNELTRYGGGEKDLKKIIQRAKDNPGTVSLRTVDEAVLALSELQKAKAAENPTLGTRLKAMVGTNQTDAAADQAEAEKIAALKEAVASSFAQNPLYLHPDVNTDANREFLLEAGVQEDQLPMTTTMRKQAEAIRERMKNDVTDAQKALGNSRLSKKERENYEQIASGAAVTITPEEQALVDKHLTQEDFDNAVAQAGVERRKAMGKGWKKYDNEDPGTQHFYNVRYLLQGKASLGFNAAQLHSMNSLGTLAEFVSDKQFKAIQELISKTEKPVAVILQNVPGMAGSPKGMFDHTTNTLIIQADLAATKKSKAKRQELFAVATHEITHAQYDQYLTNIHGDWMTFLQGGEATAEAMQFKRFMDLAVATAEAAKKEPSMRDSYYLQIFQQANGVNPDGKTTQLNLLSPEVDLNSSLLLVKEFFAEAQADRTLQAAMHRFKLDSPQNANFLRIHYNYGQIKPGTSLLSEFYNIMKDFFTSVISSLKGESRTLLKEAFDMASTIRTNGFDNSGLDLTNFRPYGTSMHEMSISNYNPMALDIRGDLTNIAPSVLASLVHVQEKVNKMSAARQTKIEQSINTFIADTIKPDYQEGTAKAILFKASASFMISWKDSAGKNHRQFFDDWGNKENVNSNVFSEKATRLSKPKADDTFANEYNDAQNEFNREVLNNFQEALAADFMGEITLEYDPDHVFELRGLKHYGQVNVVWQQPGEEAKIIGFMHDLTKVRLAGLLHKGATITMDVQRDANGRVVRGPGSQFLVKRNAEGKIEHLLGKHESARPGYVMEKGISPNISLVYKSVTGITQTDVADQARADRDTMTVQDEDIDPKMEIFNAEQVDEEDAAEEIQEASLDGVKFAGDIYEEEFFEYYGEYPTSHISEYNLDPFPDRDKKARITFAGERTKKVMRRMVLLLAHKDPEQLKAMMKRGLDIDAKAVQQKFGEDPLIANYGYESREELHAWADAFITDLFNSAGTLKNRHDSPDWEGHGKNPTNTISTRIKVDIEHLTYVDEDGLEQLITWNDAEQMLFESASRSETFDDMMEYLVEEYGNPDAYSPKHAAIANKIHEHWTKPMTAATAQIIPLRNNSIWSQLASLGRQGMFTFIQKGDGIRMEANGKSMDFKDKINSYQLAIAETVADFQRRHPGLTGEQQFALFEQSLGTASTYFGATKTEKPIMGMLTSAKTRLTSQPIGEVTVQNETNNEGDFGPVSIDGLNDKNYERLGKDAVKVLNALGIKDAPLGLLTRNKIRGERMDTKKKRFEEQLTGLYKNRLRDYGRSLIGNPEARALYNKRAAELDRDFSAELEVGLDRISQQFRKFEYNTIEFIRSTGRDVKWRDKDGRERMGKEARHGEHSALELYVQTANFLMMEAKKQFAGGEFNYALKETRALAKKVMEMNGDYDSPRMFTDANGNNRFGYKIKSYLDNVWQKFYLDKDGTGAIAEYLVHNIYKHNPLLKHMQAGRLQTRPALLGGLVGNDGKATDYASASEMDFLYMHLAGFVAGGTDQYRFLDDVPSDKPTLMTIPMMRIRKAEYEQQAKNIIETEKVRFDTATLKFEMAFQETDTDEYIIMDENDQFDLVEGAHYQPVMVGPEGAKVQKEVEGMKVWKKGWIFDKKKYFSGGEQKAENIVAALEKEADEWYKYYTKKGLNIPVTENYYLQNNPDALLKEEKRKKAKADRKADGSGQNHAAKIKLMEASLEADRANYEKSRKEVQEQIFKGWYMNNTFNRYWTSQLLMGDYMFYKPDEFTDLNKRKAGPAAPRQTGAYEREQGRVAIMRSVDNGETAYALPKIKWNKATKRYEVLTGEEHDVKFDSNRTDGQGYIREEFAEETEKAFGDFSNFGAPFKPVLFGVNKHHMEDARPSYYKLSLTVVPNPNTEEGYEFYVRQPEMKAFAEKFYASDADMVIFDSALKVGIQGVNNLDDATYTSQPFDLKNFGLQNNPKHDVDEDNKLNGMVQMEKILADMGNFLSDKNEGFRGMVEYYAIASELLGKQADELFNRQFATTADKVNWLITKLEDREHTQHLAQALKEGMALENPAVSSSAVNLFNSEIRTVLATVKKSGDKLVNQSDYGMQRDEFDPDLIHLIEKHGAKFVRHIKRPLMWAGPRKLSELTFNQRIAVEKRIAAKKGSTEGILDENEYVLADNGQIQIYGADVLVPKGKGGPNGKPYKIGDKVIGVRIPTSSPSSMIPGEVVGLLPERMGNVIITPGEGPGLLGFDFDVDGLFTWRKDRKNKASKVNEMFDIAYGVLTRPKNFDHMTNKVSTDELNEIANSLEADFGTRPASEDDRPKSNKFSPIKQIEKKESNSIGKQMISLFAYHYGVHSVLSQTGVALTDSFTHERGHNHNGRTLGAYPEFTNDGATTTPVYQSFMGLLNAATDNAKLQLLTRLGINNETAPVLVDMIAHGVPLRDAIYYINQPIIREYSEKATLQKSASFKDEVDTDIFTSLREKYENKVRQATGDGSYTYYQEVDGVTENADAIYKNQWVSLKNPLTGQMELKVMSVKRDRVPLRFQPLQNAIKAPGLMAEPQAGEAEKFQLIMLEKFKYYKELSGITSGAAQLIGMASTFPKTYLELLEKKKKINDVLGEFTITPDGKAKWQGQKIAIQGLVGVPEDQLLGATVHPFYNHQYQGLEQSIRFYEDVFIYAHPEIMASHVQLAGGKSAEVQEKVMKDFYTWVLTQHPDLQTTTFNGENLPAYDFVHATGEVIAEAKNQYPENMFLKFLNVIPSPGSERQRKERSTDPTHISFFGQAPTGSTLEKIHRDWDALPEQFMANGMTRPINLKQILLGHLAHTKGFALGTGFSTILPNSVRLSLDGTIREFGDNVRSLTDAQKFGERVMAAMGDDDFMAFYTWGEAEQNRINKLYAEHQLEVAEAIAAGTALPDFSQRLAANGVPVAMHHFYRSGYPKDNFYHGDVEMTAYLSILDAASREEGVREYLIQNAEVDSEALLTALEVANERSRQVDLKSFRNQAALHHQELIPRVSEADWKAVHAVGSHPDADNNARVEGAEYKGPVRYLFDANGEVEQIEVWGLDDSPKSRSIVARALQNDLLMIKEPKTGKEVVFEVVDGLEDEYVTLQRSTWKGNEKVKQYKRNHRFEMRPTYDPKAPAPAPQAYAKEGVVFNGVNQLSLDQFGKHRQRPVFMDEKHTRKTPFSGLLLTASIRNTYEAVEAGLRTAMSGSNLLRYKKGELFKIASEQHPGELIIAKVTHAPYSLDMVLQKTDFEYVDEAFGRLEGFASSTEDVTLDRRIKKIPGYLELNPKKLKHEQIQFEYVATVRESDGAIINLNPAYAAPSEMLEGQKIERAAKQNPNDTSWETGLDNSISEYNKSLPAHFSYKAVESLLGTGVKAFNRSRNEGASFYKSLKNLSAGLQEVVREYLDRNKVQKATPQEIAFGVMNSYALPVEVHQSEEAPTGLFRQAGGVNYGEYTVMAGGQPLVTFKADELHDAELHAQQREDRTKSPVRRILSVFRATGEDNGNQFLRLIRSTPENFNAFVVKAVLHDSALKGYNEVHFPQTAEPVLKEMRPAKSLQDRFANKWLGVETSPYNDVDLSYYHPQNGFNQNLNREQTIVQDMEQVVYNILPADAADLLGGSPKINWFDFMPSGIRNHQTGQPYTWIEYIEENYDRYKANKRRLVEIWDEIENTPDFFNTAVTSDRKLAALQTEIRRMGPVEKANFGRVYAAIGNALGDRMVAQQLSILKQHNAGMDTDAILNQQVDIKAYQVLTQSISDFGAGQLAVQNMSRKISEVAMNFEADKNQKEAKLQKLLFDVRDKYYAHYPDKKKANLKSLNKLNEPYAWMLEKDLQTGEYTGKFIKRRETSLVGGQPLTVSTPAFRAMEAAARGTDSLAELAQAQLALYQFIEDTGNGLMKQMGYRGSELDERAFMPQTKMDAIEAAERNGKFAAYMVKFGPEINDAYDMIDVTYMGQTKKVHEWVTQFNDETQSKQDKAKAPKRLAEVIKLAETSAINGTSGLSAEQLRHVIMDFDSASELPFRSIAKKKDFSINVPRMLMGHIGNLTFKKHHDPILPMMHALKTHYQYKNAPNQKAYQNVINFIDQYSNRYLFNQKDQMSSGPMGAALERMGATTAIMYMGLNPARSVINAATGLYFSAQGKMSRDMDPNKGWFENWGGNLKTVGVGYERMVKDREKALKIMNLYRVEMFSDLDIERESNRLKKVEDWMMWAQRNSEVLVRGTSFFSEMTQEQWDNFYLVTDPKNPKNKILAAHDATKQPSPKTVKKWLYYINSQQGNYSTEDRRNYHRNSLLKTAMLFKGWIIDFFQERFAPEWIDRYGKKREGYVTTFAKLLVNHGADIATFKMQRTDLTPLQMEALSKIMMDAAFASALLLLRMPLSDEDEDKGQKWLREQVGKLVGEIFFYGTPAEWIAMAKNPLAILGPLEQLLKLITSLLTLEGEAAAKAAFKLTPGHGIASDVYEIATAAEETAEDVAED